MTAHKDHAPEKGAASGIATLDGSSKLTPSELPAATETVAGGLEVATQAEADAGTDDATIITPLKLANVPGLVTPSATETVEGKAELATQAETDAGADDARIVTPLKLGKGAASGVGTLAGDVLQPVAEMRVMGGATGVADGEKGVVPKPVAGQEDLPLNGDGTFKALSGAVAALIFPVTFVEAPRGGVSEIDLDDLPGLEMPDGSDDKGLSFLFVLTDKVNLASDPKVRFDLYVFSEGSGDDDADFELTAKYLAVGELTSKAADETLTPTVAIVDTERRRHTLEVTLDRTLITTADSIFITLFRQGSSDAYEGTLMVAQTGGLEFGG